MKIAELTEQLEQQIPRDAALDWDNVGLLVGDPQAEVQAVYVALDLTDEVLEHAVAAGVDLILTHHPMIFSPLRRIHREDVIGRRILSLVEHHIAYYAMHTNFDVCVMGDLAASYLKLEQPEVLEITCEMPSGEGVYCPRGIGCVGELQSECTLGELAEKTKQTFSLSSVKVFGDGAQKVSRVAICPGSGKSEIAAAMAKGADVYITGDIDHHSGIDAVAEGLPIIDAGHYGVEHIYMDYMTNWLAEHAPRLTVQREPFSEPFWVLI